MFSCRVLTGERECDGAAAHAEAGDVAACRKPKKNVGSYTSGLTRLIVTTNIIALPCILPVLSAIFVRLLSVSVTAVILVY